MVKQSGIVNLYEDGAGGLYLHRVGDSNVYQDDPALNPGATFAQDAQAILDGDVEGWSSEWVHPYAEMKTVFLHSETALVAVYVDGEVKVVGNPGSAARAFLGSNAEE